MTLLVVFHPMDVRGRKLGGIETHVRLILARHPPEMDVLLVGIDEIGDCELGRVHPLAFEGRTVGFLPVLRAAPTSVNTAASRLARSLTLRFFLATLRRLGAIGAALRGRAVSCEVERDEFALLPRLLRRPCILVVHNPGGRGDAMDSLLKRYWAVHRASERIALRAADRVFGVNAAITARIAELSPRFAAKTSELSVSVDTRRFAPTPFASGPDFRVCFAGRLDAFKDPSLMFATMARLAQRFAADPVGRFQRLAFDYVGASDPTTMDGFDEIGGLTTCHGARSASEVAAIMRNAHVGIVTSFYEGMPCYLLEILASGRPAVSVDLPQFAPLILPGRSGYLVARQTSGTAEMLADAFVAVAREIGEGALDPANIAAVVAPYTVETQMGRLFACHAALAQATPAIARAPHRRHAR